MSLLSEHAHTSQELHASLEGGNLDAREVEKAKAGQTTDYPNGACELAGVLEAVH